MNRCESAWCGVVLTREYDHTSCAFVFSFKWYACLRYSRWCSVCLWRMDEVCECVLVGGGACGGLVRFDTMITIAAVSLPLFTRPLLKIVYVANDLYCVMCVYQME